MCQCKETRKMSTLVWMSFSTQEIRVNSAMDQPVDEAVPDKNQGTGNGLLPVTESPEGSM